MPDKGLTQAADLMNRTRGTDFNDTLDKLALISDIVDDLNTSGSLIGTNTDVAGTTTLFARLRQIVDTYLADGTIGLAALDTDLGTVNTAVGTNTDVAGTTTLFARLKQIVDTYLADGTIGLSNIKTIIDGIKAKTDLMNSASGTSTLNDGNTSDVIVPGTLPTKIHLTFDISNLNNNLDDFDIEVKVGVAASERVIAYYNLTSDGTDITVDKGSGIGSTVKQRRIDISDILVYTGEQVIVQLTKNGAADRNVVYKYLCGV